MQQLELGFPSLSRGFFILQVCHHLPWKWHKVAYDLLFTQSSYNAKSSLKSVKTNDELGKTTKKFKTLRR